MKVDGPKNNKIQIWLNKTLIFKRANLKMQFILKLDLFKLMIISNKISVETVRFIENSLTVRKLAKKPF